MSTISPLDATNGFINPSELVNCTVSTCPIITSYYNYRIALAPNALFLALFSLSFLIYFLIFLFTWCHTRLTGLYFFLAMEVGIIFEVLGYVGRVMSWKNQWGQNGFIMQTVCLTIAPAFFSAGIYLCLGRIVVVYSKKHSRLPAGWYTRIFIPCDIVSMVLQGIGAGIASVALQNNGPLESLITGDNVMIAGIATQVFTTFVFMSLCVDFGLRVRWSRSKTLPTITSIPGTKQSSSKAIWSMKVEESWLFKSFLMALAIATICVFWRSVFRVVELNAGWLGPLTFKQNLFVGFEGLLMIIAIFVLAIFHPGFCMGETMSGRLGGEEGHMTGRKTTENGLAEKIKEHAEEDVRTDTPEIGKDGKEAAGSVE